MSMSSDAWFCSSSRRRDTINNNWISSPSGDVNQRKNCKSRNDRDEWVSLWTRRASGWGCVRALRRTQIDALWATPLAGIFCAPFALLTHPVYPRVACLHSMQRVWVMVLFRPMSKGFFRVRGWQQSPRKKSSARGERVLRCRSSAWTLTLNGVCFYSGLIFAMF
jgi:hypothetical protein